MNFLKRCDHFDEVFSFLKMTTRNKDAEKGKMDSEKRDLESAEMLKLEDRGAPPEKLLAEEEPEEREKWSSHFEYLLSMVGYSVGIGNLWRFPYVCNRNGGGAFLIPFVIYLMLMGFPMFSLESGLGQFSGKSTVRVWSFCPLLKGSGVGSVVVTALYVPFYQLLLAWPIYYMVKSCAAILPWTTCGNEWNTPMCVADLTSNFTNTSLYGNDSEADPISVAELWKNNSLSHTSVEEFWQYNVLGVSDGIDQIGSMQWHVVGCMFAAYAIIVLCLSRGVHSVGKVVYVTALLPYILLILIFIRTMMQPGAVDGVLYYVKPDFKKLLTLQVWLEACLQVFYSLGPGWGLICTAASYKKFHAPFIRDGFLIATISEGTSVFGGFVTFGILGAMSNRINVSISEVVSTGPGLGFVAFPSALAQLPLPQLWSFLFFLMLLTVGLDSQFMNVEVVLSAIVDRFPKVLYKRRLLVLAGLCFFYFLVGLIFCTQGGPYIFQILDWYIGSLSVFIICMVECVAATWIYGIKQLSKDIELMLGRPLSRLMRILWGIVAPFALLLAFVLTLTRYQPPTYGKYVYPDYAIVIGWIVAILSVIPLPVCAIIAIRDHMTTKSIKEGIISAARPNKLWRPQVVQFRDIHRENLLKGDHSVWSNLQDIFMGDRKNR